MITGGPLPHLTNVHGFLTNLVRHPPMLVPVGPFTTKSTTSKLWIQRACHHGSPLPWCVMRNEQEQDSSPLVPIEQQTILYYGKLLVVVRLPHRLPAIVLCHRGDSLRLEMTSQVRRFKRTEAIPDDLLFTQIQTDGGQRRWQPRRYSTLHASLVSWMSP
jgi:hypothetical protein